MLVTFGNRRLQVGSKGQADQEQEEGTLRSDLIQSGLGFVGHYSNSLSGQEKDSGLMGLLILLPKNPP